MSMVKIWQVINQNMFEVTNKFEFESAHRLAKGYVGRAKSIHGHLFKGEVTIFCKHLHRHGLAMPLDKFENLYKDLIEDLEHSILLYKLDKDLINLCKRKQWKYILFNDNPTPETITKWLYENIKERMLDNYCELKKVSIETKFVKCEYYD